MSICIEYVPNNANDQWPKEIQYDQKEFFTKKDWKALYQEAKEKQIPEYLIGVTETLNANHKKVYHLYDGVHIRKNIIYTSQKDPIENRDILEIYYLSIKCFDFDPQNVTKECDSLKLQEFFSTKSFPEVDQTRRIWMEESMLDGVNYYADDKILNKRQLEVANSLLKSERNSPLWQEGIRWLYCASKTNHAAKLKLTGYFTE